MKLLLTLVPGRCHTCSYKGWCDEKLGLCLRCRAQVLEVESRKTPKPDNSVYLKFRETIKDIAGKLREFNTSQPSTKKLLNETARFE